MFEWSWVQNQDPSKWNIRLTKVAYDGSTVFQMKYVDEKQRNNQNRSEVTGPGPVVLSKVQNQDPSKWNRCSHRVAKVANDGSTLNNEAKAQTLDGPSVLYDQQHF